MMDQCRLDDGPKINYSLGPYNKCNEKQQWIRISEGCPHNCPYCYEPQEIKFFGVPEIIKNDVKIMDMNILAKKEALDTIRELGDVRVNKKVVYYEFICGIDYRFLTQDIADAMKRSRFKNIRIAWDWWYSDQHKLKDAVKILKRSGYKPNEIMIFMICNWEIPYLECVRKLEICKYWGVKVADCYFDNQIPPGIIPVHWLAKEIKSFRRKVRKHNQIVNFGIDPQPNIWAVEGMGE